MRGKCDNQLAETLPKRTLFEALKITGHDSKGGKVKEF